MNQEIDGTTVLNSGNYKILFGRQFYTNTRMGKNLVFEYKFPYTYMRQNCNQNEIQQLPLQQMRPPMRCPGIKYIYLYLTPNGLHHEELMNPYPENPNPQADQTVYHNTELKLALFRQWKIVMIIDETIINNINFEYNKSKGEFFAKMKKLEEMRRKQF
jgi:hypothetical protein